MIQPDVIRYRCMPRASLSDGDMSIEAVQFADIEAIRLWRNAQMDVLRQTAPITPDQQVAYYAAHVWPDMDKDRPENILLTFKENGKPIGYGGLVHIAWEYRRAEVSFLLDSALTSPAPTYARYFAKFLGLIRILANVDLGLERLFTETYEIRTEHIAVLEAMGFQREGVMREHVRINGQALNSLIHGLIKSDDRRARR